MATSTIDKCSDCGKAYGRQICPGCHMCFCKPCAEKHDGKLAENFQGIVIERDKIQEELDNRNPNEKNNHPMITEIRKWEKEAIAKVHQTAEIACDALQDILGQDFHSIVEKFKMFSKNIRQLHETQGYLEPQLKELETKIKEFRRNLQQLDIPKNIKLNKENSNRINWDQLIFIENVQEPVKAASSSQPQSARAKEPSQFADPKTSKTLPCEGRPCAKCHKCRDWYFTGDAKTWNWVRNWDNWSGEDWDRYDKGIWKLWKERDGATCLGGGRHHHLGGHGCVCEDNRQ